MAQLVRVMSQCGSCCSGTGIGSRTTVATPSWRPSMPLSPSSRTWGLVCRYWDPTFPITVTTDGLRTEVEGRDAAEQMHQPFLRFSRLLQALHDVRPDDQDEAAHEVDTGYCHLLKRQVLQASAHVC